jgi:aminoglycoside phosphotransferase (APT) family kinase protein
MTPPTPILNPSPVASYGSTLGERHHADRMVCVQSDECGLVVRKRYVDADAASIYADMETLWSSPFGAERSPSLMPRPISLDGSVITMSFVAGDPLGRRGSLGSTLQHLPAVASLLAELHNSGAEVHRIRTPQRLLRSLDRKAEQIAEPLRVPFHNTITRHLRPIAPESDPLVVSHGDFSPRNVLADDQSPNSKLVLIDFDRLQMSGRGRDVAYFGAWAWVTGFMSEPARVPSWEIGNEFAALYAQSACVSESSLRATAPFYRAASLLRIAQSWSALHERLDLSRAIIDQATMLAMEAE